jgi:PAS domain S-box-containing protein
VSVKIKILHIVNIAGDAMLISGIFADAGVLCEVRQVDNKIDFLSALGNFLPQLVLADDRVPGLSFTEALTELKEFSLTIPFIALGGNVPDNPAPAIVNAIKQGAYDYIPKDYINTLPAIALTAVGKPLQKKKFALTDQNYRQIVETAQEGIWMLDENMVTIFVNKKTCELLGYPAEEIIGKRNADFRADGKAVDSIARFEQQKLGVTETHESVFLKKSGELVYLIVATNGLFNAEGKYFGALAMLTDITERKAHENALKRSEANLSAIIENTTDLVYSLDRKLQVITYNQLFKTTIKQVYGFDIFTGANTLELIEGFDAVMGAKWKDIYRRALDGEAQQFINEYTFGPERAFLSYSINPILETGKVIGLSCFSRDITKQKLNELEREKITADLLQRNNALEQFTYIISHNLRAPVANIIGLSSLLTVMGAEDEDTGRITSSISHSASKLDDIISDLNQVLQVTQTANEHIEAISLSQLISDIKSSIGHIIEKEHVTIDTYFEVDELLSLKSFIYSILYNLVLNSIKFRKPSAEPLINIKAQSDQGQLIITYSDNGRGIDISRYGNEIFGLYKRFDTSVEGKGMGLFMIKTQVESLGGTINVNSILGKGTEFVLKLPQMQLTNG